MSDPETPRLRTSEDQEEERERIRAENEDERKNREQEKEDGAESDARIAQKYQSNQVAAVAAEQQFEAIEDPVSPRLEKTSENVPPAGEIVLPSQEAAINLELADARLRVDATVKQTEALSTTQKWFQRSDFWAGILGGLFGGVASGHLLASCQRGSAAPH